MIESFTTYGATASMKYEKRVPIMLASQSPIHHSSPPCRGFIFLLHALRKTFDGAIIRNAFMPSGFLKGVRHPRQHSRLVKIAIWITPVFKASWYLGAITGCATLMM
jgi:hypothetical protein